MKKILKKIKDLLTFRSIRVWLIRKRFTRKLRGKDLQYIGLHGVSKWIEFAETRISSIEKMNRFKGKKVTKLNKKLVDVEYYKEAIRICKSL